MSATTFFRGRIGVKTEAGLSILSRHLSPWTREEVDEDDECFDDECFVEFEDDGVMLCGYYRNLCRYICSCIHEVHQAGELGYLNIIEWNDDGDEVQASYHLRDGVPHLMTYGTGDTSPYTTTVAEVVEEANDRKNAVVKPSRDDALPGGDDVPKELKSPSEG